MKRVLMWTATTAGIAAGTYFGYLALARARHKAERGLEGMERVTTHARAALEETEKALKETRQGLS
jgi:hypothetical protein